MVRLRGGETRKGIYLVGCILVSCFDGNNGWIRSTPDVTKGTYIIIYFSNICTTELSSLHIPAQLMVLLQETW